MVSNCKWIKDGYCLNESIKAACGNCGYPVDRVYVNCVFANDYERLSYCRGYDLEPDEYGLFYGSTSEPLARNFKTCEEALEFRNYIAVRKINKEFK